MIKLYSKINCGLGPPARLFHTVFQSESRNKEIIKNMFSARAPCDVYLFSFWNLYWKPGYVSDGSL